MSMRDYPCSGHVLSADKVRQIVYKYGKTSEVESYDENIKDGYEYVETDALELVQEICKANGLPAPESAFILSDEDTVNDNLERHVWYFYFDEDALYERTMTKAHKKLEKMGFGPTFEAWAVFG